MVTILILSLALFSGATSASQPQVSVFTSDLTHKSKLKSVSNVTILDRYPTIVQVELLNIWDLTTWNQNCAASVLNSRYVLSAVTCFSGWFFPNASYRRIRAGANYRNTGGVVVYVDQEINYQSSTSNWMYDNDISVVRLSSRLIYSNVIQQASIPAPGFIVPNGIPINQLGWGRKIPQELSSTRLVTFRRDQSQLPQILTADPTAEGRLNGDIGGPWILGDVTVAIINGVNAIGNASWSEVVATSIAAYTNWIISVAV